MKKIISVIFMIFIAVSCSSNTKKEIARDKEKVGPVHTREEMIAKTRTLLEDSPNLSESQRENFIKLHTKVIDEVSDYNDDIRKLKVVLFKELAAPKYNKKKVDTLTKQIRKLYNKKLDTMMNAMGDARNILGVQSIEHFHEYDWFDYHSRM